MIKYLIILLVSFFYTIYASGLNQSINDVSKLNLSNNVSGVSLGAVHPFIPFTSKKYIIDCNTLFSVEEAYKEVLSCVESKTFPEQKDRKILDSLPIPTCKLISIDSPDVHHEDSSNFNYITLGFIYSFKVVGFYEEKTKEIFVVQNKESRRIWKHELQHYFLHLLEGDGNGKHDHQIWSDCMEPYFVPDSIIEE